MASRRRWWWLFVLSLCVSMAWGLATPKLAGPDERDHAIRAVTTVRGNLIGSFLPSSLGYRMRMRIPHDLCTGILLDPALCLPTDDPERVDVDHGEYRHPPPYYAVVGLPSLVWDGANSNYLMRLVSAALGSALLAWALSSAIESGNRLRVLGVLTVATPIVWFLIADINPNGVEIAAAICVWTCALTVATERVPSAKVIRRCGIALTVLVMSRGISPVYGVMALGAAAIIAGRDRRRELITRRDVRLWLAAGAAGSFVTGVWVLIAGFSHNVHRPGHAVSLALRETGLFLQESVGDWLDLRVSLPFAVAAYAAIALPILTVGLTRATKRDRGVVVALLLVALVLPLTSNTFNVPPIASAWQGRYGLPMVAGVIIAAAFVSRDELGTRLWRVALGVLGVAHTSAFVVFVRHGVDSSSRATVLVVTHAVAVAVLCLLLDRASSLVMAPGGGSDSDPRSTPSEQTR